MRPFLAIVFLTIFSFQILPVKEIGKILWNGTMTEEVHEHGPTHKKLVQVFPDKNWYQHFLNTVHMGSKNNSDFSHALRAEALIPTVSLEVPLQPPNLV